MQFIIDFIDFIINTITTVWDFFMGIIENLIMLVKYLGIVAKLCYSTLATMPTWLQAFGTLTIVVSILFVILGRETGGSKE